MVERQLSSGEGNDICCCGVWGDFANLGVGWLLPRYVIYLMIVVVGWLLGWGVVGSSVKIEVCGGGWRCFLVK